MRKVLDPTGWTRVIAVTIGGTLFCIGVAFFVDSYRFSELSDVEFRRALWVNTLVPMLLAAPLLSLLMSKIRQLALAHKELEKLASTDGLTTLLNRGAFTMLVEAYLEKARVEARLRSGALLLVDVDHFKSVNDQFGHDQGDRALRAIAWAIKSALRAGDAVGRLGGEEFGAFLPGADSQQALIVAERVRASVRQIPFAPAGSPQTLSVSVGAVSFTARTNFENLYIEADKKLYQAKRTGRDRVMLYRMLEVEPS